MSPEERKALAKRIEARKKQMQRARGPMPADPLKRQEWLSHIHQHSQPTQVKYESDPAKAGGDD